MAEETTPPQLAQPSAAAPVASVAEPVAQPVASAPDNEELQRQAAQLQRARQENQRLKLQLKEAQANSTTPLISEEQTWFVVGAAAALLGVLAGALLRGGRGTRREWLN
ncbi:translation initiation factor 2 (IF-2, GTPase) [Pseudomonas sp. 5P_3.1_Bac2]|uniref:translation initiation factor 2 (IF-2, GTPase) n=1 Tax=Pseudomonas sp. 5P_3.1_Bac2 TaxID=2971617 RepID=UPI0021C6FCAB|nr:translation initiation factor 2 (IF-2, GTPase) [Pseudomonas sp. 5P_3.1_Bac2]